MIRRKIASFALLALGFVVAIGCGDSGKGDGWGPVVEPVLSPVAAGASASSTSVPATKLTVNADSSPSAEEGSQGAASRGDGQATEPVPGPGDQVASSVAAPPVPNPTVELTAPRDVSALDLFSGRSGGVVTYSSSGTRETTVEEVLEAGLRLAGASPVHIALRGMASASSVRCDWRGIARTLEQRERAIRFWLRLDSDDEIPDAAFLEALFTATMDTLNPDARETAKSNFLVMARGGLSTVYLFLTCYADYTVSEYLLGAGPTTLTVAYDRMGEAHSYGLYRLSHAAGEFGDEPLLSEGEYQAELDDEVWEAESSLVSGIGGRESVVFLAPMGAHHAIAIEAWQVVAQWDVQRDGQGTVNAVRYGAAEGDPEHTQTLLNLKSRITTATSATSTMATSTPSRIGNVSGLTQYYRDIGAYGDITPDDGDTATFTPSQPPPVYAPAPASLTATASGETTELGEESADLSWSSVTGASGYHVQHRISGDDSWTTAEASVTGTSYAASGLWCGRTHEFRVGAYGDGGRYNARAGLWSPTATATTAACSPLPPRFRTDSYSFEISALAPVGDAVGTVSAFDLNDDPVTYSITAGNEDGRFVIASSSGEITVAASLRSAGDAVTLTVGAADGVTGTTSVTVTILLTATCSDGIAVSDAASDPGLVSDCETLLAARDELAGTATLDWNANSAMTAWEGVTMGGTPMRVTHVDLDSFGLTGSIPPGLSGLPKLEHLSLSSNRLTGGLPPELGSLSSLADLSLNHNLLTGAIPSELGSLSSLEGLRLSWNRLTGEIPAELGGLSALTQVWLSENELSGEIPLELGSLTNLKSLYLKNNELSGDIPSELGSLTGLRVLRIAGNGLTGCAPTAWRDLGNTDLDKLGLPYCDGVPTAPQGLGVSLADGVFSMTWDAVTGASRYEAQYRIEGSEDDWAVAATTTEAALAFSPEGGPACGTTYEFRVRASGGGTADAAEWGAPSDAASATTGACSRPPEFSAASYDFSIAEDIRTGRSVGSISATDPDDGDTVSYAIIAGNERGDFAIDDGTGEITVSAHYLDHEAVSAYTLTVEASDGRGGAATATVEIGVTDVGAEHAPSPPGFSVSEVEGGFSMTWDAVPGAVRYAVQYRIPGVQDQLSDLPFTESTSLEYRPAEGVRCETAYEFRAFSYGDGTAYLAAWGRPPAEVTSVTTGACNQAPEFASSTYSFSIAENAATSTPVGAVSATDRDTGDTVSYAITEGNEAGKFAVGESSGEITVAGALDHETIASYSLTVEARDGNGGTATATVEIGVTDVAEDAPPAPQGLSVTLADGTFSLTWGEVTGAARYEAQYRVSGSDEEWATLEATEGTSSTLSPEGGPACGSTYEFRVRAYGDGETYAAGWGAASDAAYATTDACNQAPVFDPASYDFTVSEDAATGDSVGAVSATDPDADDTVTYAITAGNGDGKFAMDESTGAITVAGALDHEATASYSLTVEASDGNSGTATTTVEIGVTDVPEDAPSAPEGLSVSLANGEFSITWDAVNGADRYEAQYRISGFGGDWASVATTTAAVLTFSPDGGPVCGTTYEFRVRAYGDGTTYVAGWGAESDSESVTTGACNRDPKFGVSTYSFSIAENAATSTPVGTVSATDPDEGDTVSYAITAGNGDGKFAIGASTGDLTVAGALDPEVVAFYVLTVEATDGSGGGATATVGISLIRTECSNGTVVPRPDDNPKLVRDCSLLLAARDTLAGDGSLNWSADVLMSSWQGVTVDWVPSLYLKDLMLTGLGLTGSIPGALGGLEDLRRLDLDENELTGGIPPELGRLSSLDQLYLFDNQLSGDIPSELGNLSNLTIMYLHDNMLSGVMPPELAELNRLRNLTLDSNRLTGAIPSELGDMDSLEELWVRDNLLAGEIPSELEKLSDLSYLYLEGNGFAGCIPSGLRDVANNDLDQLGLAYCSSPAQ